MSASSTTCVQFNFKMANGDLLNVYADSIPEAEELLDAFSDTLVQKYYDVASVLQSANTIAAPAAPPSQPAAIPAAAPAPYPGAAAPAPQAASAPVCDHGTAARYVPGGISKKTNRPYPAFYACANPRETQCGFKQSAE